MEVLDADRSGGSDSLSLQCSAEVLVASESDSFRLSIDCREHLIWDVSDQDVSHDLFHWYLMIRGQALVVTVQ